MGTNLVKRTTLFLTVSIGLTFWSGTAWADVYTNVAEAANFKLVYELAIPTTASNFRDTKAPTYSVNDSASIGPYDRVAYYLELDDGNGLQWVYVSMDPFSQHTAGYQIGLPHNLLNAITRQQVVSNMNVYSNVSGIVTGTGIATGSVEMWPSNYSGTASGYVSTGTGAFDWNDSGFSASSGHSSFQIHNWDLDGSGSGTAGQTLLAYNRYGHSDSNPAGAGIGNDSGSNTDWTFSTNAGTYTVANLQILVHETQRPYLQKPVEAPAQIVANVPEAEKYSLVYELPIHNGAFNSSQYTADNSASVPYGSYGRIAYYMELESAAYGTEWVWVSMDAFNLDAGLIGVPNTAEAIQQMIVNNLEVLASDGSGVTSGSFENGNIEFWNTNYGAGTTTLLDNGSGSTYDFNDTRSTGGTYGSMQIHNSELGEVLLAFNHWNGGTPCIGIGSQLTGNPDWTFADNAGGYTIKNLYVLVGAFAVPEPSTIVLLVSGLAGLGLVGWRRRRSRP